MASDPTAPTITMLPPMERYSVRCRHLHIAAASRLLGIELPRAAYGTASRGGVHALWLGPDEWLVLTAQADPVALVPSAAWIEISASVVDIGHRQVALSLSGEHAETSLASGCPLDLALSAFPVGACTRTLFHKAEIVLWRTAPNRFHIEVWRSFAPYVEMLLNGAGPPG